MVRAGLSVSGSVITVGLEMDTTMMSEIEYNNMLPELMDIEESSFFKAGNSFVMNGGGAQSKLDTSDTQKTEV